MATVTTTEYLETIREIESDIFRAMSIDNDGDDAMRFRVISVALSQLRYARQGIAENEQERRLGAKLGGWRAARRNARDARGRFVSRESAERDAYYAERGY